MNSAAGKSAWQQAKTLFREAVFITFLSAGLGMVANLFHPRRIPFVTEHQYQTLVPCPVPGKPIEPCPVETFRQSPQQALAVDARAPKEYNAWHVAEAINIPYDYLEPVPEKTLKELAAAISRRKPKRIVVYGDGRDPDSGEQLGRELSAAGFRNVCFVKGGAGALKTSGGEAGHE